GPGRPAHRVYAGRGLSRPGTPRRRSVERTAPSQVFDAAAGGPDPPGVRPRVETSTAPGLLSRVQEAVAAIRMTRSLGVRTRLTLGVSAVIVVTCGALGWLLTRGELLQLDALVAARGQGVADYLARNGETEMLSADRNALRRLGERVIDQQGIAYA